MNAHHNEIDLTGRTIGRMRVAGRHEHGWHCECRCGKEPVFTAEELKTAKSCGCIVVLGVDPATNTGWAVRYLWRDGSATKCGTFNVGENDSEDEMKWEGKYALAANMFLRLLKEHLPDFVVFEEPEHGIRKFQKSPKKEKGAASQSDKPAIDIAAIKQFLATLSAVMFKYGMYSKQASEVADKITGTSNANQLQLTGIVGAMVGVCMNMNIPFGMIGARSWHSFAYRKGIRPDDGRDWKDIAIEHCDIERITLPPTKKESRDAAEAVGIARSWTECKIPQIKWMQDRFKALRSDKTKATRFVRNERQVAA